MDAAHVWQVIIDPHPTTRYVVRCRCLGRPGLEIVEPMAAISQCNLARILCDIIDEYPPLEAVVMDDHRIAPLAFMTGAGIRLLPLTGVRL